MVAHKTGKKVTAKAKAKAAAARARKASTIPQKAAQKLRENFKHLGEPAQYVRIYPVTGRTLYQQVQHDIGLKEAGDTTIVFGHTYYSEWTEKYSEDDSYYQALKPHPDDISVPNDKLLEANTQRQRNSNLFLVLMASVVVHNFSFEAVASLKDHTHPDRGPLLSYLRTASSASRKDAQGVWRLLSSLRLTDAQVQLPVADKVIAWDSRLFVFVFQFVLSNNKIEKEKRK